MSHAAADHVPWEEAELPMLDEPAYAAWKRDLGERVLEHRGRHWVRNGPGFFHPVHPLARLSFEEATRPAASCWGFRARLRDEDASRQNAAIPVHLLPDPAGYDLSRLASKRRTEVRRALKTVEVVTLKGPALLLDQGYPIAVEQHARVPAIDLPEPDAFRDLVLSYFEPPRGLAFAALSDGRLLAFTLNAAVDGTAYCQQMFLSNEVLALGLSIALFHALAMAARRCAGIREVMNGLHVREREDLCAFKRRQGFEIVMLPARAWFAPGFETALRWWQPHRAYRMTGRG